MRAESAVTLRWASRHETGCTTEVLGNMPDSKLRCKPNKWNRDWQLEVSVLN